jgi:hypothetical protein
MDEIILDGAAGFWFQFSTIIRRRQAGNSLAAP